MIRYVEHPAENWHEIAGGFLRVKGQNPVVARLLLQIPQGEYITRELISRVVLAVRANPGLEHQYDLKALYYSLGAPEDEADFGSYRVPVHVYVAPL